MIEPRPSYSANDSSEHSTMAPRCFFDLPRHERVGGVVDLVFEVELRPANVLGSQKFDRVLGRRPELVWKENVTSKQKKLASLKSCSTLSIASLVPETERFIYIFTNNFGIVDSFFQYN